MRTDKPRVLIVEDEPTVAMALAKYFTTWGWESVKVFDGTEAIVRLNEPFHLIALDLMLPVVDGAAVLREIQARGLIVPVAVMTAMTPENAADALHKLTPDKIFFKPYIFDAFADYALTLFDAFHAPPATTPKAGR